MIQVHIQYSLVQDYPCWITLTVYHDPGVLAVASPAEPRRCIGLGCREKRRPSAGNRKNRRNDRKVLRSVFVCSMTLRFVFCLSLTSFAIFTLKHALEISLNRSRAVIPSIVGLNGPVMAVVSAEVLIGTGECARSTKTME